MASAASRSTWTTWIGTDFLKTLAEACQKTGWQVHAYCLMSNHYHLVVETPKANLVAGMAWLQSAYTIRLNHRHKLIGHVLSGRLRWCQPGLSRYEGSLLDLFVRLSQYSDSGRDPGATTARGPSMFADLSPRTFSYETQRFATQ